MNNLLSRGGAVVVRPIRWLLAACALLALPLLAAATAPAAPSTKGAALATALRPDGTLRPEARGSFDATGYTMRTAPGGQPSFRPDGVAATLAAGAGGWQDKFSIPGLGGTMRALAVAPNGDVLAGGSFLNAGGNQDADRVARWDGTAWRALGTTPLNNTVRALAVTANGDVLAGGDFLDAGNNLDADRVARWTVTGWQALGTGGLGNTVRALAVALNGDVLAGGTSSTRAAT